MTKLLPILLVVACGSSSMRTVQTPRYYAYSVVGASSLDRDPPPVAPPKAAQAIAKLRRVAFVPPDSCLDMRAGDTATSVDKRVVRMQCGVTMSELEREAENVGFDVVTWQSLKGSRPLEQAKDQKIELLFEVNELDVVEDASRAESIEFRYFQGEGDGPREPLQVTPADNDACKAFNGRSAPKISGLTSVLDIKMVQVSNGSVLWSYRHEENANAARAASVVRFPVNATREYHTRRPWWPWLVVAGGVALLAVNPVVGAVVAGAGGIGVAVMPARTRPAGEPTYESVSAVLCRRPPIVDAPAAPARPSGDQRSDTFRSQTKVDAKDPLEERRRELIKKSVQVFMRQLSASAQ